MSEDVVGLCYIKLFSVRIGQEKRRKNESIWRKENFDTWGNYAVANHGIWECWKNGSQLCETNLSITAVTPSDRALVPIALYWIK